MNLWSSISPRTSGGGLRPNSDEFPQNPPFPKRRSERVELLSRDFLRRDGTSGAAIVAHSITAQPKIQNQVSKAATQFYVTVSEQREIGYRTARTIKTAPGR